MARIQVKPRIGGKSAQLAITKYSPARKRGITVTLGTLRLDKSIEAVRRREPGVLSVREGQTLTEEGLRQVVAWLRAHKRKSKANGG